MLDVGADADLDRGEREARVTAACCSEAAEVVLPGLDVFSEAEVICLMGHLAESDIAVDSFGPRLFYVKACDIAEAIDVDSRVCLGKELDELKNVGPSPGSYRNGAVRIVVPYGSKSRLGSPAGHND